MVVKVNPRAPDLERALKPVVVGIRSDKEVKCRSEMGLKRPEKPDIWDVVLSGFGKKKRLANY